MDSFLTTYRKDYRWPVVPPITQKTLHESSVLESKTDPCCQGIISVDVPKPEIYPPQLSSIPSAANRENQPDGFLNQLYDSFPYLYNIKKAPSEDTKRNILRQRFITTYQRDFCKEEDIEQRENQADKEREKCQKTPKEKAKEESILSRLRKPTPKLRATEKSNEKKGLSDSDKLRHHDTSEYMDSISKTGAAIIQQKLLLRKPK